MGIGSSWAVEIAEQDHQEALQENIILEAATCVAVGESRDIAYKKADELSMFQQEAISKGEYSEDEETGAINFFDSSLSGTAIPAGKEKQVAAIANSLREEFL